MREILFRGKEITSGKWCFGVPVKMSFNSYSTKRIELVNEISYDELDGYIPSMESEEVSPKTLGQYSGIVDKNGTRIFEGDIVEIHVKDWPKNRERLMRGVVEWKNAALHITWCEEMYGRHFLGYLEDVEVIGNKFDNTELIT